MSYVGKPMPRVDARDKVMGRAKYAADLCDRNVLTAKILHAEHAHALVKSINVERARAMEGVEAVFTWEKKVSGAACGFSSCAFRLSETTSTPMSVGGRTASSPLRYKELTS